MLSSCVMIFLTNYFRSLIKPSMLDGILAPDTSQRLKYKDWLHVYAKDVCRVPSRMSDLISQYQVFYIYLIIEL